MAAVSLLTPVPLEHLVSATEVCSEEGKVAFGSRAWEVFRQLDEIRDRAAVDVYIYASGDMDAVATEVSWTARYLGHLEGINGMHPAGKRLRPHSTFKYPADNIGHWAVFWEVDKLRRLEKHERIPISSFHGYTSGKRYGKGFIPEGPLVVASMPLTDCSGRALRMRN